MAQLPGCQEAGNPETEFLRPFMPAIESDNLQTHTGLSKALFVSSEFVRRIPLVSDATTQQYKRDPGEAGSIEFGRNITAKSDQTLDGTRQMGRATPGHGHTLRESGQDKGWRGSPFLCDALDHRRRIRDIVGDGELPILCRH